MRPEPLGGAAQRASNDQSHRCAHCNGSINSSGPSGFGTSDRAFGPRDLNRYSRAGTLLSAPHCRRTRSGQRRRAAARNATTDRHWFSDGRRNHSVCGLAVLWREVDTARRDYALRSVRLADDVPPRDASQHCATRPRGHRRFGRVAILTSTPAARVTKPVRIAAGGSAATSVMQPSRPTTAMGAGHRRCSGRRVSAAALVIT